MDSFTSDGEHRGNPELEAAIESLNRGPSREVDVARDAAGPAVDAISKIEWLETELCQQKRNFENVDRRLDDLSSQIAALCSAITTVADQPPAVAAEPATPGLPEATGMDCMPSVDGVSDSTVADSMDRTAEMRESGDRLEDGSNDDDSAQQLLEIRTRGAVSLDNLLAKLSAVDSDNEYDAEELPQPCGNAEPESIQSESPADDEAVALQKNKLEELFASLRNREEERQVDDSLITTDAVDTFSENPQVFEHAEGTQHESSGLESTEFKEEPVVAAESVPCPAENTDGEDVQDYMNSLLQRLKSGEPAKQLAAPTIASAMPPTRTLAETHVKQDLLPEVERLKPDEFLPKQVAPEKNANMVAMRELANASSRSAVKSSALRRQKARSNFQLLLAGGGIAGAALTSSLSQSRGDLHFFLSISLIVITVACIYFYARANIFGQNTETDASDVEPHPGSPAGFDWSKLNEFTTLILSKLNRSPKESS